MKPLNLFLLTLLCFITVDLSAQKPKKIKDDLLQSFREIDCWNAQKSTDSIGEVYDSLARANDNFYKKLKFYGERYPFTIEERFPVEGLSCTSSDGLFKIYSWDTDLGGLQHTFKNVIQYKWGERTNIVLDTTRNGNNYVCKYDRLYTLIVGNKTYYLATYFGIFSLNARGEGMRIFTIENGRLNDKVKLIKTKSGLTNKLYYSYDQHLTNSDNMSEITLEYDPKAKTITFPLIAENMWATETYITYKFNGQYFEKVKGE
ncbi:hypothetical protein ACPPVU_25695 [Mucilaginibacter sp. McL0603]|uniref:hypothetical protein n=1 Tax=Mucilaginibacter sp. McL0603 TaxID=3415670 RepID=UPI003CF79A0C